MGHEAESSLTQVCLHEDWRPAQGCLQVRGTRVLYPRCHWRLYKVLRGSRHWTCFQNTANELCKCEGINLCDHSLRIKIGRKKRNKIMDFSWANKCDRRDNRQLFGKKKLFQKTEKPKVRTREWGPESSWIDGWVSVWETSCFPRSVGEC